MAYLFVLNGTSRFRALRLAPDCVVSIGKRDDADLCLKDPWISWSHAEVHVKAGEFAIKDLGSTNGTYINLGRVEGDTPVPLCDEDVIFLGGTHLLLVTSDRIPSAPPRPLPPPARDAEASHHASLARATTRLKRRPGPPALRPIAVGDDDDEGYAGDRTIRLSPAMIDSLEGELALLDDGTATFTRSAVQAAAARYRDGDRAEREQALLRPVALPEGSFTESQLNESGLLRGSVQIDLQDLLGERGLEESGLAWGDLSSSSGMGRFASLELATEAAAMSDIGSLSRVRAPEPGSASRPRPKATATETTNAIDEPSVTRDGSEAATTTDDPLLDAFDPVDGSQQTGFDPDLVVQRDREIADLKSKLAERDQEVGRLRHSLLRLKEQYLDL